MVDAGRGAAASQYPPALVHGGLQVTGYPGGLVARTQRAHVGARVTRVPESDSPELGQHPGLDLVVDRLMDERPAAAHAALAARADQGTHDAACRPVEVGLGEDDMG